jgi:Nicotinic acid mononucleotide adenylyltransferase
MKKVGLLGGSFDPPHRGHLFISLEAKKVLKLSEIWWLVTPKNPLKINNPASYLERINNCNKFVKNHPIKIKQYEKKIDSSYSYLTIKYLNNKYRYIKFFWLMGADNLIHFHKWQKMEKYF